MKIEEYETDEDIIHGVRMQLGELLDVDVQDRGNISIEITEEIDNFGRRVILFNTESIKSEFSGCVISFVYVPFADYSHEVALTKSNLKMLVKDIARSTIQFINADNLFSVWYEKENIDQLTVCDLLQLKLIGNGWNNSINVYVVPHIEARFHAVQMVNINAREVKLMCLISTSTSRGTVFNEITKHAVVSSDQDLYVLLRETSTNVGMEKQIVYDEVDPTDVPFDFPCSTFRLEMNFLLFSFVYKNASIFRCRMYYRERYVTVDQVTTILKNRKWPIGPEFSDVMVVSSVCHKLCTIKLRSGNTLQFNLVYTENGNPCHPIWKWDTGDYVNVPALSARNQSNPEQFRRHRRRFYIDIICFYFGINPVCWGSGVCDTQNRKISVPCSMVTLRKDNSEERVALINGLSLSVIREAVIRSDSRYSRSSIRIANEKDVTRTSYLMIGDNDVISLCADFSMISNRVTISQLCSHDSIEFSNPLNFLCLEGVYYVKLPNNEVYQMNLPMNMPIAASVKRISLRFSIPEHMIKLHVEQTELVNSMTLSSSVPNSNTTISVSLRESDEILDCVDFGAFRVQLSTNMTVKIMREEIKNMFDNGKDLVYWERVLKDDVIAQDVFFENCPIPTLMSVKEVTFVYRNQKKRVREHHFYESVLALIEDAVAITNEADITLFYRNLQLSRSTPLGNFPDKFCVDIEVGCPPLGREPEYRYGYELHPLWNNSLVIEKCDGPFDPTYETIICYGVGSVMTCLLQNGLVPAIFFKREHDPPASSKQLLADHEMHIYVQVKKHENHVDEYYSASMFMRFLMSRYMLGNNVFVPDVSSSMRTLISCYMTTNNSIYSIPEITSMLASDRYFARGANAAKVHEFIAKCRSE